MAETFDFPTNPGSFQTTVTPGSGSAGFSSRALVFADANGALTNNSSGPIWDTTQGSLAIGIDPSTLGGTSFANLLIQQGSSLGYGLAIRRELSAGSAQAAFVILTTANAASARISGAGVFLAADGTTAGPGVSFSGDGDNGMYRIGTNEVGLVGGGQVMHRWTSNALGFYGSSGQVQPSSYTTNASVGTTRANSAMTATTDSTANYTLIQNTSAVGGAANAGFSSTATLRTFVDNQVKLVNDVFSMKQLLNSLINDLKAWGLSG